MPAEAPPEPCVLPVVAYSIEAEDARALEKALHRRFASRQIREGGGTEYFRASVQEVVAAIESIATQVSAKRASQAFAADLLEYKKLIGAYVVEQRIDRASLLTGDLIE